MKLVVLLALPPLSRGWGDGHPLITRAALPLLPASFISGLRRSNTTFLGLTRPVAEFVAGTAASKDIFDWSESADVVAGPCTVSPCPALELQAKLTFRRYCYAEDSAGAYTPPWPFAVPACGANVTSGCLPGPVRDSWMYHYFNETPSVNEGIEARGASWYLGRAALALRGGNLSTAALHLGCFSHALQDRSSPYHAWGGYTAAKKRVEVEYRTTETCLASNLSAADKRRCEILFWAPGNEPAVNWSAGGYAPIVLGASAAEAGAAVGARLEELAARARGVMLRPTDGFVASHLRDGDWWLRTSSPATLRAMGEMGRESTRLVADAWLTAWALAHDASAQLAPLLPPRRPVPLVGAALTEWAAAVRQAAQRDREVDEAADSAGGAAAHRAVRRGGRTRGHELGWGEPPLLVAVATDASPSEAFAARSLVRILSQSGVPSKAVSAADAAGQPHVAVGAGAAVASNATLARELDALGTEDFVCRSNASPSMPSGAAQPTLVLSGSSASPRGTLNAVFRLLRHLGYRHYAPDAPPALPTNLSAAAVLAPRSSARCGAAAPRQRPSIAVRTLNAFSAGVASLPNDVNASEFAVANQLNGAVVRDFALNETYGGSVYYAGGFVHTSYDLAPPCASWISAGTCAANDTSGLNYSHPEWFGGEQLCWMNASLVEHLILRVRELLRRNPAARFVSVSQNDNSHYCTRAADQAVIDEEGSAAAPMLRAVNAIALNVSKDYPMLTLTTLAYDYSRTPPARTVPRENVAVRLCDIEANFAAPLTDPSNAAFLADLSGWREITSPGQLHAWSYVANFDNFVVPYDLQRRCRPPAPIDNYVGGSDDRRELRAGAAAAVAVDVLAVAAAHVAQAGCLDVGDEVGAHVQIVDVAAGAIVAAHGDPAVGRRNHIVRVEKVGTPLVVVDALVVAALWQLAEARLSHTWP